MQLHRLRLQNFRQHADTDIVLGPGITAIIGPNGSGKTTLLEAIAWAFYGTGAVRGNRDGIRWNRAPARSPVRVEVECALGGHEYRIVRTLYQAELYQDAAATPLANSQQDVTAWMQRLLGMTRDEFFNTYFTGQKELAVMAAMGPTERGRFLSRVMGYERLRHVQDRLREVRSTLRGELAGLERALGDADALERERAEAVGRHAAAATAVVEAEKEKAKAERDRDAEAPRRHEAERMREAALALDGDRRVAEQHVDEARRQFERLDRELAEALAARSQLAALEPELAQLEPLREESERLDAEARAAGRRRSLAGQLEEVRQQRERLAARLGDPATAADGTGTEAAEQQLARARAAAATVEAQVARLHTELVRDRQDAETKRLALRDQYKDLVSHRAGIVEAGPDGACPTCARPLGAEYESVLAALERQIEEVEMNGKFFRQRIEQLAVEPAELRQGREAAETARREVERAGDRLAAARLREHEAHDLAAERQRVETRVTELERTIAELPETYDEARHDAVRRTLRALEPAVQKATELTVKASRAERLVREAEEAERALSEREGAVRALQSAITDLGYSEERYAEARGRHEEAEQAVRQAELTLLARQGDHKAAQLALTEVQRRVAEREARASRAEELHADVRLHDELDAAVQDLRTELNAQLRPELSDLASSFLADLTDGRYHELELDEQYRVLILEESEAKPVISGGEEDVANLVLRLAISQMVAERAGQPLSLLVLDEIFGSLDESRRQHVVSLLRRLADRFPQVILITHIESVRDSVDRVIRVTLDTSRGAALVRDDPGGLNEDVAA